MNSRRAVLYVPGDDAHKIEKGASLGVDSICMDLGDAVTAENKANARETVVDALETLEFGRTERLVRINPVDSLDAELDLAAILQAHPDGIVVPEVETPEALQWVSRQMTAVEDYNVWPKNCMSLIAGVETAKAIINLDRICQADSRLVALFFGAERLAVDLGASLTSRGEEFTYARSAIVLHAAAFGLQPIDSIHLNFRDIRSLRAEARMAAEMGFLGKQVIHPDQARVVQNIFTPDETFINQAQALLDEYAKQQKQGAGSFAINGQMINKSVIRTIQRLIERARDNANPH
jgi:citrate lyase beta subunit